MTIQADKAEAREGQRIAKVMARAGLCSRRDAEQWIAEGRVSVNGEVLTSPAFNVGESDDVRVDDQPLKAAERTRLFLFHKPRGLVTTAKDPEGRPTIFDALPQDLPRVVTIGRLDINTEGLLLLTNDGGLARALELPSTGWLRRYRVRAHGEVTQEQLDGLSGGVTLDGIDYRGIEARFERQQGSNVWMTMGLREGKNREIKRVLEHMGLSVNRLIRVSFGPFELADLADGEVVEVRTRVLRDQLGTKLAKLAGANFDAPAEASQPAPAEPPRGDRPLRRSRAEPAPEERREGPPRKRKHVTVLRAEARAEAAGPRKRIARATTADRKGREVKVERVSLARPPEPAPERAPRRPPRDAAPRRSREEFADRREAARPPRRDDRAPPRRDSEAGARPQRPRDEFAGRREGARPPRREDRAAPRRASEAGARPQRPRDDFAGRRETARPPRGDDRAPPRRDSEAGARPQRPRDDFAGRREGARPPRRDDRAPPRRDNEAAARPQRPRDDFAGRREGARPPRRDDHAPPRRDNEAGARPQRPRDDFAGRREGARPPRRDDRAPPRRDSAKDARSQRPRDDRPRGERPGKGGGPPQGGKPGPRGPRAR